MASRLNHLFQTAPLQFMQRTVLFVDGLRSPESASLMRNKIAHCIDLELSGQHNQTRARVLPSQHLYQDTPLIGYFAAPGSVTLLPRENPPLRFVFLSEFTRCRLLIAADGPDVLRLQVEENLSGVVPPLSAHNPAGPATYLDSFAYWDYTYGELVGVVRATAVLYKQAGEPWMITMQQIVGASGHEVVRQTFTRPLIRS